jgi:hypothetical protein
VGFNAIEICVTFCAMERWTIGPWSLFVLMGLLFLIVVILILPEVDLPDTAFHGGTAPVDVHSRVTSAPGLLPVRAAATFDFSAHPASRHREQSLAFAHSTSSYLPLLHRSLRC